MCNAAHRAFRYYSCHNSHNKPSTNSRFSCLTKGRQAGRQDRAGRGVGILMALNCWASERARGGGRIGIEFSLSVETCISHLKNASVSDGRPAKANEWWPQARW